MAKKEIVIGEVVNTPEDAITEKMLNIEELDREAIRSEEEELEKGLKNKDRKWIVAMIQREATPLKARTESLAAFCEKHNITEAVYYFYAKKPEYRKRMVRLIMETVKEHTGDIMNNLALRAKTDNKAAELFLDYVLELSKNFDFKTDGRPLIAGLTNEQKTHLNNLLENE